MSALVPAPPMKASQLAILAPLGEAIIINRAKGLSAATGEASMSILGLSVFTPVAIRLPRRYRSPVAAQSATGFEIPARQRRTSAHYSIAGAFFTSAMPSYGGCARGTLGCAGFLCPRYLNPRTAAAYCLRSIRGSSHSDKGAPRMSALVPAPPMKASQLAILAPLGEAIIINCATGTSASRARLIVLLERACAVSAISAEERQAVIGGAK